VIDPNDPSQISWSAITDVDGKGYRSAATYVDGQGIYWIGGSDVTYNFDGIAYNGSGGVSPREDWRVYDPSTGALSIGTRDMSGNGLPRIMDLRGIALLDDGRAIIAGGMEENQVVTDKVFLINLGPVLSTTALNFSPIRIAPNPALDFFAIEKEGTFKIELWDGVGRLIVSENKNGFESVDISTLDSGVYFLKIFEDGEWIGVEKVLKW